MPEHRIDIGSILLFISIVPLAFLVYTMMNITSLHITINHPRVIAELSLFLVFLMAGVYWKYKFHKN